MVRDQGQVHSMVSGAWYDDIDGYEGGIYLGSR